MILLSSVGIIIFVFNAGLSSPIQALDEAIRCRDLLDRENFNPQQAVSSLQSMLFNKETSPAPWAGFFTGASSKPAKVINSVSLELVNINNVATKWKYVLRCSIVHVHFN